jgi:lactoylglutathione lyase
LLEIFFLKSIGKNMQKDRFRILGLQQIALGGLSREPLLLLWQDLFGLESIGEFTDVSENIKETRLRLGNGAGGIEVDIMEPIDANRSPRVHVPPLNHIALWVDRLEDAVAYLEEQGVRFASGGIRKGAAGHNVAFIHPRPDENHPISGEGVLIELVQAPDEMFE